MINKEHRLTQDGYDRLKQELEQLQERTKEVAEDIATARKQGDLSENAEYQNAKDEQRKVSRRIKEIDAILASAEIIDQPDNPKEVVFGSTVELSSSGNNLTYTVVGSLEADPGEGKISDESPIGQALLGAKPGQTVSMELPAGTQQYTVESIS